MPEPAQVEMYITVDSQEELQAPASSSMVRRVRWHTVCNWVSGSLTYSYWGICSYFALSYWGVCRGIIHRMNEYGTKLLDNYIQQDEEKVCFFIFSDDEIWPKARQQVQEQAPVEQVVWVLVLVETGHPSP